MDPPSPADAHQVIHVGGSGAPRPGPHTSPKAEELAPASALGTRGDRGERTGWGAQRPRSRARDRPRDPGGSPGAPRTAASASRLLARAEHPARTPLLAFLGCALPARTRFPPEPVCQTQESAKGKAALDLGFAGLRGPGSVGWAPAGQARGGPGRGARSGGFWLWQLRPAGPTGKLRSRAASALCPGPGHSALIYQPVPRRGGAQWAGRGEGRRGWASCLLGVVVLISQAQQRQNSCRKG